MLSSNNFILIANIVMWPLLTFLGLAGKTPAEEAQCDMMVDAAHDLLIELRPWFGEKDEAKKVRVNLSQHSRCLLLSASSLLTSQLRVANVLQKEFLLKFVTETLPPAFEKYQKLLEKNNGGKGFIVGDSVSRSYND